ncbi:MAG TPA: chitinase [Mucilaginibacter sp.]|nr:chitinase [Mucilaginibacter sp.]
MMLMSMKCGSASVRNAPVQHIRVSDFLSEKQFNDLFPMRNKFYTYSAFIKAVNELGRIKIRVTRRATSVYQIVRIDKRSGSATIVRQDEDWNEDWAKKKGDSTYTVDYGNFCTEKELATDKKELAAFFANIAHETRHGEDGKYNDGLMFIHENNTSLPYVADNDAYPAVAGKKYYGRGPMQLSYNGNYGYASDCIFGNKHVLLDNPDLVETDPVVAFETAIYFWMTPQTQKPSAHDVITGKWHPSAADQALNRKPGFGMTINIINGAVECGQGDKVYSMNDRIGFYRYFLKKLGVSDPNCVCSCGNMAPYK